MPVPDLKSLKFKEASAYKVVGQRTMGVDVPNIAAGKQTAEEIAHKSQRRIAAYSADTGDDRAVKNAMTQIASDFGRIDILVNAAAQPGGQSKPPKLPEITNDHLWADMNV